MVGTITYPVINGHALIYRATNGGTVYSANLYLDAAMDYFEDAAVVNDAIYFGHASAYAGSGIGVKVNVGTPLVAAAITVVWEYYDYDAAAWVAVSGLTDPSNAFQNAGIHEITWDYPARIFYALINGKYDQWVRCRISAVTAITEGGANQTTPIQAIHPTIEVTGNKDGAGAPWTMNDIYAADIAGGWGIVRQLKSGFPSDVGFDDWPIGTDGTATHFQRTWMVNAAIVFYQPPATETVHFLSEHEIIILHCFACNIGAGSEVMFGSYEAATDTTSRGSIVLQLGYGFGCAWTAVRSYRPALNFYKLYATLWSSYGAHPISRGFIHDVYTGCEFIDVVFRDITQFSLYGGIYKRVNWLADRGINVIIVSAAATFEDVIFQCVRDMSNAVYLYRNIYPITLKGGQIKKDTTRNFHMYMQCWGYFDTAACFHMIDVNWDEDGGHIYWLATMPLYPSYGYISNEKTLNIKVVDDVGSAIVGATVEVWDVDDVLVVNDTTNGTGDITETVLVQKEFRAIDPEVTSLGSVETAKTPHHIRITKSGYRTVDFYFSVVAKMDWIIGMPDSGGGPPGAVVEVTDTTATVTCPSTTAVVEVADT